MSAMRPRIVRCVCSALGLGPASGPPCGFDRLFSAATKALLVEHRLTCPPRQPRLCSSTPTRIAMRALVVAVAVVVMGRTGGEKQQGVDGTARCLEQVRPAASMALFRTSAPGGETNDGTLTCEEVKTRPTHPLPATPLHSHTTNTIPYHTIPYYVCHTIPSTTTPLTQGSGALQPLPGLASSQVPPL